MIDDVQGTIGKRTAENQTKNPHKIPSTKNPPQNTLYKPKLPACSLSDRVPDEPSI
jgi:hypothetical protein